MDRYPLVPDRDPSGICIEICLLWTLGATMAIAGPRGAARPGGSFRCRGGGRQLMQSCRQAFLPSSVARSTGTWQVRRSKSDVPTSQPMGNAGREHGHDIAAGDAAVAAPAVMMPPGQMPLYARNQRSLPCNATASMVTHTCRPRAAMHVWPEGAMLSMLSRLSPKPLSVASSICAKGQPRGDTCNDGLAKKQEEKCQDRQTRFLRKPRHGRLVREKKKKKNKNTRHGCVMAPAFLEAAAAAAAAAAPPTHTRICA